MPDMPLYALSDPEFGNLVIANARLEELYSGGRWLEGPVWFDDAQQLLFSDIPNQQILRWVEGGGASIFRAPSNFINGNTRDREGRLVSCEHGGRRLLRTEIDGSITVLAERFDGKRLNSPNDVVVHSDGSIWFSDPSYGILSDYEGFKAPEEQESRNVYRLDPATGTIRIAASDFLQPNGLAFSPDECLLYVADSGASHVPAAPRHIRVFDVLPDHSLTNGRVFAELDTGIPDGIRTDIQGNLWSSAGDGVHCFAPDGRLLGKILVPQVVSNLTFGGPRRNRLFITASTSLYAVYTATTGAQTP